MKKNKKNKKNTFTFLIIIISLIFGIGVGYFLRSFFLPPGVILSTNNKPKIENNLRLYDFEDTKKESFNDSKTAKNKFEEIKNKIKKGKIFYGKGTILKMDGNELKEKEVVSITISVMKNYYITSFVIVSSLVERNNYFELVLSTTSKNIIDGYYKLKLELIGNVVKLYYNKVQNPNVEVLKLFVSDDNYKKINQKSVQDTLNNLFN